MEDKLREIKESISDANECIKSGEEACHDDPPGDWISTMEDLNEELQWCVDEIERLNIAVKVTNKVFNRRLEVEKENKKLREALKEIEFIEDGKALETRMIAHEALGGEMITAEHAKNMTDKYNSEENQKKIELKYFEAARNYTSEKIKNAAANGNGDVWLTMRESDESWPGMKYLREVIPELKALGFRCHDQETSLEISWN